MDLKSLTLSSWMKDSWGLYWSNLSKVWKVYIFSFIPVIFFSFLEELGEIIQSGAGTLVFALAIIFIVILMLLVGIALIIQLQNIIQGKDDSVQGLFTLATPIFWPYVFTTLLYSLLIVVGFVLLIVPGIIFAIYWSFVDQSVVLRGKSYMKALDYSYSLVHGRWWRVLGYVVFMGVLVIVVSSVPDLGFSLLGIPGRLAALLISGLFMPIFVIAELILFLHLEKTRPAGASQVPQLLLKNKGSKSKSKSSRTKRR